MANKKLYEIAKELEIDLKEFIEQLKEFKEPLQLNLNDPTVHLQTVTSEDEKKIVDYFKTLKTGGTVTKRITSSVKRRRKRRIAGKTTTPPAEVASKTETAKKDVSEEKPEATEKVVEVDFGKKEVKPVKTEEKPPVTEAKVKKEPEKVVKEPEKKKEVSVEVKEKGKIEKLERKKEKETVSTKAKVEKLKEREKEEKKPPRKTEAVDHKERKRDKERERERDKGREEVSKKKETKKKESAPEKGKKGKKIVRDLTGEFEKEGRPAKKGKRGKRILYERKVDIRKTILEQYNEEHEEAVKEQKAKKKKEKKEYKKPVITVPKEQKRVIKMEDDTITVGQLAKGMSVKASDVIKKLMELGSMATINTPLDFETAYLVAEEFNYKVKKVSTTEEKYLGMVQTDDPPEKLKPRPPVITIMGHVDHGKTSLLDVIRKTNVTAEEAGGITQKIGAYKVEIDGKTLVFIDTPGHEAFTTMRARGAKVTDIVVLIVAADDGVQPQTIEAINHAKAAGVPIIVAVNKIDKDNADVERVKRELTEYNLIPEDWGGDTQFVYVSAKKKINIDVLLENIIALAELLELKANPDRSATGYVIESRLDKKRGPIATLLVKNGTLKVGDIIVCGTSMGRVRAMTDENGKTMNSAPPSIPAEVTGLDSVPEAGEMFFVVESEKDAKDIVNHRISILKEKKQKERVRHSIKSILEGIKAGEIKDLNIILKGDVQGSIEAIKSAISKIESSKVNAKIIHSGIGAITENDINLAISSNALVIGFNVRPDSRALDVSQQEHVEIKTFTVIYDLIDYVKSAMEGLLEPKFEEKVIGVVEVRQIFHIPKVGTVAGCYVKSGKIVRNKTVRLYRNDIKIYEGAIASLKRLKDDVREVVQGYECGVGLQNYQDIKVGDIIEVIDKIEVKETL